MVTPSFLHFGTRSDDPLHTMDTKPLYLLLADDDEDDCLFFADALAELPIATQLTTVYDGEQLMELLSRNPEPLPYALFLDLNMPRKNGYECLRDTKADERLKTIPVIILSTYFDPVAADRLYKSGAQCCIRKPVDMAQLKGIIEHALARIARSGGSQPLKKNFILDGELNPSLP